MDYKGNFYIDCLTFPYLFVMSNKLIISFVLIESICPFTFDETENCYLVQKDIDVINDIKKKTR